MRIALTLIAVFLIAALSAALVGPLLIDWSAHRGAIEAELARRLGARVVIGGPIEVRLLPTPYLVIEKVTVGEASPKHAPLLQSERMRFELGLGGLAGGQFRFTDVTLERPALHFALGPGNAMASLREHVASLAQRVELDRIVVKQGAMTIDREGAASVALVDIGLEASAKSLLGPFRASGEAGTPQGAHGRFQLVTADIADAAMPIKAEVDLGAGGVRAAFDGKLTLGPGGDVDPVYVGAVNVTGSLPEVDAGAGSWPWKISGAAHADSRHARLENLSLRLGPDARALEASGVGDLRLDAALNIDLQLTSKQLNLDSLLRHEGEDSAPPARCLAVLERIADFVRDRGDLPVNLVLGYATPSVFLGAQTLDQLSLTASGNAGQPLTGHFEAGLPGQSHLLLDGALELGVGAGLRGHLDARVGDFRSLREWAAEDQPELGAKLEALGEALPTGVASANGDIEASSVGFSARNLNLALDRSHFTGAMAFTRALNPNPGRLFLDLRSDALDMDAAPNLEAGAGWLGDLDMSLALQATKLRVARVGQTSLEGGSLMLQATKSGSNLSLDRLSLADLGGATIEAQAQSSPSGRWARVKLDAARLRDFAALVARVAPGRYSRMLVERAAALSPAKATFEARRDGPPLEGPFGLDFVKADGEAGKSRFSLKLSRAPAPVDAIAGELSLDSSDGAVLLRQLGAEIPSGSAGRGRISASASGNWDVGFDAQLSASLVGADLNWRGRFLPNPATPTDPSLFGAATLKSDNVLNALSVFGVASPNSGAAAPVDLSADFVLRGRDATLPRVSGTVAGAKITGNLAWRAPTPPIDAGKLDPDVAIAQIIAGEAPMTNPALISGELSLDHASASGLLALPLGFSPPMKPGVHWSDAKFGPPLLMPPQTDIALKIGALDVFEGTPARNFTARLAMDPSKFDLGAVAMDLGGGRASGRLTLRRDGPVAALTGQVDLESINADKPVFHARIGASLDFAGTGSSLAALAGGLVGQGQVKFASVAIPHMDAGALGRVLVKAGLPDAPIDETNISHALTLELDRQPLAISDGVAPATLNSGILRVGPIGMAEPTGRATASAAFDLRSLALDMRISYEESHADKFWSGAPPSVTVSVHSGDDASTRTIDAAVLIAGLAAQAIARESDRIAALESDLRERAFFNRQMKAEHFLERREAEIAAFEAEQVRLKFEADRKRVEDELQKALEDQRRAAAAAAKAPPPPPAPAPAREVDPALAPVVHNVEPQDPPLKPKGEGADPTSTGLY